MIRIAAGLARLCLLAPAVCAGAPPTPVPLTASSSAQDDAEAWIEKGHRLRVEERWADALAAYEEASERNGDALASRLWELRCWMELSRINDALDVIDGLAREDAAEAAELAYLYGMAFARKAEQAIAAGTADSSVSMNLGDAVEQLSSATSAEPERFADALPHLAQAAYNTQRNAVARGAAEAAVRHSPDDVSAHHLLGRIALSQFVVASGDGSPAEVADGHWQASVDAFRRALEVAGEPAAGDYAAQARLAGLYVQLGYAYGWKPERAEDCARAFEDAMAWDPTAIEYAQVWDLLGVERFADVAERAAERFAERAAEDDVRDATLHWYLGRARFEQEDWEGAEEAFATAVAKWPAYADSWFYIGRARYARGEYRPAIEAFRQHWEAAPEGLVATVEADAELNVSILDWLVGKAVEAGDNLDAAFLSRVCAEVVRDEPRYWNNVGLFLRDEGEKMLRSAPDQDVEERTELFERSYDAYSRALALSPGDPALLNDTALLLHYHLKRDLDQALDMYERAYERAVEELAREDLPADLRSLYEIAKRDANNNRALLEQELAEREAGGETPPG